MYKDKGMFEEQKTRQEESSLVWKYPSLPTMMLS